MACGLILLFLVGVRANISIPASLVTNNFNNKIGLEVLRVSPVNTVVSPLLLRFPLCKLSSVATGMAKFELMVALGYQTETQASKCHSDYLPEIATLRLQDFVMVNKIYINESLDVAPSFIENSTELFGVRVEKVGFKYSVAASQFINNGFERDTLKRVTNLIEPEDININTSMVILNAAAFKLTWEKPFYVQLTKEKIFRNMKNEVFKTPMMVTMDSFYYLEEPNLDITMITLRLIREEITFVMPNNRTELPSLIEKIYSNRSLITQLRERMKIKDVTISLPKFKIKTYVDWTGFLRLIGINSIMKKSSSGLDGILKPNSTNKVFLSSAKQKIFLEINEFGSKRFAYQEGDRDYERMLFYMDHVPEVVLDKPFYFLISFRYKANQYDLFHGVYYGPQEI